MLSKKRGVVNLIYLVLIILVSIFIRFLYLKLDSQIIVYPDTYGYYEAGQDMLKSKIFVDESRTPIYSLFLNIPSLLQGNLNIKILSPQFFHNMKTIILFQHIISISSLVILYFLLLHMGIKKTLALFLTLFISLNIILFAMDRLLLPESLTISYLIVLTISVISLFKSYSLLKHIILLSLFIIGFSLKPIYTLLPLPLTFLLIFYFRRLKVWLASLLILFIYLAIIYFYIQANNKYFNYQGISSVTEYNLLGKILELDLQIEQAADNFLYAKMKEYRAKNGEKMPFRFMEFIDPLFYKNQSFLQQTKEFNRIVLTSNFYHYVTKSLLSIPKAQRQPNQSVIIQPPVSSLSLFFHYLYLLYSKLQVITLITIPGFLILLLSFIKKQDKNKIIWLVIGFLGFYQIVLSVFFSYGEFGRLIAPSLPQIYLFSLFCWVNLIKKAFYSHQ